jgi:hypothetical protein
MAEKASGPTGGPRIPMNGIWAKKPNIHNKLVAKCILKIIKLCIIPPAYADRMKAG